MSGLLACRGLGVRRGRRVLVEDFDFSLAAGEIVAVVGPNGAGKSSLLATLAGLLPPESGGVFMDGRPLARLSPRRIASRLGFLPQDSQDPYPATVLETALIGRHPHIGFWQWESAADVAKARAALRRVGLAPAAARAIATLSGGERRRLAIATLLTQAPQIYLLDEPLETLDFAYQARLLRLLRGLARLAGAGIMLSLHDLSLAARHADRAVLLDGRGGAAVGSAREVLRAGPIAAAYGCRVRVLEMEGLPFYVVGG
ncbi:MAG TPA: ABC transporter ATP-binding protein [Gammaproteobacteria bacterium]|nr:ABC transporter ATP-binding protein [Gammaproteobacteria bacterium]